MSQPKNEMTPLADILIGMLSFFDAPSNFEQKNPNQFAPKFKNSCSKISAAIRL